MLKKLKSSQWLRAMLIRVIRTMAQTALGMVTIGASISDIQWTMVASVSIVAGVYSLLTSLVSDLPEVERP